MRLKMVKSAKSTRLYAIKSTYDPKTGKSSSKLVEKLGSVEEIMEREGLDYQNAILWAKHYIKNLPTSEKSSQKSILVRFNPLSPLTKDLRRKAGAGHLFAEKICAELELIPACEALMPDLNSESQIGLIAQMLVCKHLIAPTSNMPVFHWSRNIVDAPNISPQQIYSAIKQIGLNFANLTATLYRNARKICRHDVGLLCYHYASFLFENNRDNNNGGLRQFDTRNKNTADSAMKIGLITDGAGIPLAFHLASDNNLEQKTTALLRQSIRKEFRHARLITVAHESLSPDCINNLTTHGQHAHITPFAITKLETTLRDWALDKTGWHLRGQNGTFNMEECERLAYTSYYESVFYKERSVKNKVGHNERLIVTFSLKKREQQQKLFSAGTAFDKLNETAPYFGFSAAVTNLVAETDIPLILSLCGNHEEMREYFGNISFDFRPGAEFVSRENRIKACFFTCFTALLVSRIMQQRLEYKYSASQLSETMEKMDMLELPGEGWIPVYTRTDITDALHETFGFRTDTEIITQRHIRAILTKIRTPKTP